MEGRRGLQFSLLEKHGGTLHKDALPHSSGSRVLARHLWLSKHENSDIPAALMVWKEKECWHKLEEAELLIHPFCDASFLMQQEANTMAHVMLVLLNLYHHISKYCGDN
jgi:hypothetical protein